MLEVEESLILSEEGGDTEDPKRRGPCSPQLHNISFPADTVMRPGSGGNRCMEKELNTTGH